MSIYPARFATSDTVNRFLFFSLALAPDWHQQNDSTIAGLSVTQTAVSNRYSLSSLRRDPLSHGVCISALILLYQQIPGEASCISSIRPSLKLTTNLIKIELESDLDYRFCENSTGAGRKIDGFISAGYFS